MPKNSPATQGEIDAIYDALTVDNNGTAVDAVETPPTETPIPEATARVADFLDKRGDDFATENELSALGVPSGAIASAERNKHVSRSSAVVCGERVGGYSGVAKWLREQRVACRDSEVLDVLPSITPAEAIDPEIVYDAERVAKQFGISEQTLRDACGRGLIGSMTYLPGQVLIDWVESAGIEPQWPIEVAAAVARKRHNARIETPVASESKPASAIDSAFDRLEQQQATDEAAKRERRQGLLDQYRSLLGRRNEPDALDAELLIEVCQQLGFDRERVRRDAAAFDEADRLTALVPQAAEAVEATAKASQAVAEEKRRHDQALKELKRAESAARSRQYEVSAARGKLRDLQTANPDLFASAS